METSRLEKSFIHSEASLQQLCHQIPENPSQARPGSIEAEDGIFVLFWPNGRMRPPPSPALGDFVLTLTGGLNYPR